MLIFAIFSSYFTHFSTHFASVRRLFSCTLYVRHS